MSTETADEDDNFGTEQSHHVSPSSSAYVLPVCNIMRETMYVWLVIHKHSAYDWWCLNTVCIKLVMHKTVHVTGNARTLFSGGNNGINILCLKLQALCALETGNLLAEILQND